MDAKFRSGSHELDLVFLPHDREALRDCRSVGVGVSADGLGRRVSRAVDVELIGLTGPNAARSFPCHGPATSRELEPR